ncbi:MAG: hypothetical protein LBU76_07210 [Azoarcus sp.]|jgi:hypothetical protein|nr:hypothetical protein [Azoarcus sp.]
MKKTLVLFSAALAALLAACMNPPPRSGDYMATNQQMLPEESERVQALLDAGKAFSHVVTVPAADNMLSLFSNEVSIGTLKMGSGSGPADSLFDILRGEKRQTVAVTGRSDALTAATIEAAIKQLDGNPTNSGILFAGKQKYVKQLQKLADKAGVSFEGVVFPLAEKEEQAAQENAPVKQEEPPAKEEQPAEQ